MSLKQKRYNKRLTRARNSILARLRLDAEQGPEAIIAFREKQLSRFSEVVRNWIIQQDRENDYTALLALRQNLAQWLSTGDLLSQVEVQCLLYDGDRYPFHAGMQDASKHIPDARFVSLPDMGHIKPFLKARELILSHVKQMLTKARLIGGDNQS